MTQGVTRYHDTTTGRDERVSQDKPLPVTSVSGPGGTSVSGVDATGAAPTSPPVYVGGIDQNGNVAPIYTVGGYIQTIAEQMQGQALGDFSMSICGMDPGASALPPLVDTDGNWQMVGNVGSGTADKGNPVKIGGVASDANPSPVAAGSRVSAWYGLSGAAMIGGITNTLSDSMSNDGIRFADQHGGELSGLVTYPYKSNGLTWDRDRKPRWAARLLASAATTNATLVLNNSVDIHRIFGRNTAATSLWLKIYNKATAPVVGTDTPILTLELPTASSFDFDLSSFYLQLGFGYALTGAAADNDTTAVAAGDITGLNIIYAA